MRRWTMGGLGAVAVLGWSLSAAADSPCEDDLQAFELEVSRVVVDGAEVPPGTRIPPSTLSATSGDDLLWSLDGERVFLEVAP